MRRTLRDTASTFLPIMRDRRLMRTSVAVAVSRLGGTLLVLSLLFTVFQSTGDFAVAASASALFALGAVTMPLQSRFIDRYGQRLVIPVVSGLYVLFAIGAAVMGTFAVEPAWPWLVVCSLGGLVVPPFGPSMRAQLREAISASQRTTGYAMDTIFEDIAFVGGSLLAAAILAVGKAYWGLVGVAALTVIGAVGLSTSPYVPPRRPASSRGRTRRDRLGPLRSAAFWQLLLLIALVGVGTWAMFTFLAAIASRTGQASVVGVIEALAGLLAILGSLWWGRRRSSWSWRRELSALSFAYVPVLVGCALFPSLWAAGILLALTGAITSPVFIVAFNATDEVTDSEHQTESNAWVETVYLLGGSLGTAAAGWMYGRVSDSTLFGLIAALFLLSALVVFIDPRRVDATAPNVEHRIG